MSHEVLVGWFGFLYAANKGERWAHDAIHDMESFFWVLVYIALTRESPGGKRRRELERCDHSDHFLLEVIGRYFDGYPEVLRVHKQKLFTLRGIDILERDILPQFHTYFNPLKDLVQRWYKLLVMAFQWRSIECIFIHDFAIDLLEKKLQNSSQTILCRKQHLQRLYKSR
jgi:hypothetical protein